MIKVLKELLFKYKEIILYGIFGCGATLINIIAFHLLYRMWGIGLIAANVSAWILAFLFSFITNKIWVFESRECRGAKAIREMRDFLIARLGTLALDTFSMWLLVETLHVNSLFAKIMVNIVVIAVNYVASKQWVFKKGTGNGGNENEFF